MASSWRSRMAWCMPGSKTANPALPPAFAMYIATSALRTMSAAPAIASWAPAMPMLAEIETTRPATWYGARSSRISRSAMARERRRSGRSWVRMANSSPPSRAMRSSSRTRVEIRLVTDTSSSSPAAWPSVSLTILKSSRSMNRTAEVREPCSPAVSSTRSRLAWNERRLAAPVSESRSARSRTRLRSTALRRLSAAMEASWATTPMTRRSIPVTASPRCSRTTAPTGRPSATIGATITWRASGNRPASTGSRSARSRRCASGARAAHARTMTGSTASRSPSGQSSMPCVPRTTRWSSEAPRTRPRGNR